MSETAEKKHKYPKFERYFIDVIKIFLKFREVVRDEAPGPAGEVFDAYNEILNSTPAQLDRNKERLTAQLEKSIETFDGLKKKLNDIDDPVRAPFSLRLTVGGAREKARKHILDAAKASRAMLDYLENRDDTEMSRAYELLREMTYFAKYSDTPPRAAR